MNMNSDMIFMMHVLFWIGWAFWAIYATSLLSLSLRRTIINMKERSRVAQLRPSDMTLSDMRVLYMGDRRDPIERHIDSMTASWRYAGLAVSFMVLYFFTNYL